MSACSITSPLKLIAADIQAYRVLERYHYCDGAPGPYCAIYALARRTRRCSASGDYAGVIVYAPSPLNNAARDIAAGGYFAHRPKSEKLALLNAHVRRISRVIIEPRYRGLGLAVRLVRDTLPKVGVPLIEASAAMGHLHPFFERAGMRPYAPELDLPRETLRHALIDAGIGASLWLNPPAAHECLCAMTGHSLERMETAIRLFLNRYGRRRTMPPGLERTSFILGRLTRPPMYYAWLNPCTTLPGLSLR
jgi:GNAT superfamily N-acetyltransferase